VEVYDLLEKNGGNRSGIAIGEVDWRGDVHPDQFTRNHTLGNVRERKFGDIWSDLSNPVLAGLRNRSGLVGGRCAACRWFALCNGNFRARAEAVYGDFWAQDPACYLTDEEIGLFGRE
jgi:radical SAM protein with 4Fe4S-binding SPASM domain